MINLKHIKGDVRKPIGTGDKIIIHCCNDIGVMGAGVAAAIAQKWSIVKKQYLQWHRSNKGFKLGNVQFVKVEDDILVCNMIGQRHIRTKGKVAPIRYGAISKCLEKVKDGALKTNASVHCPYLMGCGLAGGSWSRIESMLQEILCDNGVAVTTYNINV